MKYDFIEIGTSDFDTLIEQATDSTVGLSIEPLKYYLDRLPNKPKIKKLNVAISPEEGNIDIYHIPADTIAQYSLPYWVRGSNSAGVPHQFTIKEIGEDLYNQIVKVEQVKCISIATLITENEIDSVDYLKIDTEGMDHIILQDYLTQCSDNPNLLPKKIKFERNSDISNMSEIDQVMDTLKTYGYSLQVSENDVMAEFLKIPRIIHQTFKTSNLPLEIQKTVNGLKNLNPTFEYRFYDDQACEDFIRESYNAEILEDYLSINPIYGSARADFFRYLLMYKVGGIYLDIKSTTSLPLDEIILPTDEYILTHWKGKDWAQELNYVHGELQNWQIICVPNHPFLKEVIKTVRSNIQHYKGELGKLAILRLTGPIAYSKAIIPMLDEHRKMTTDSPVREFGTAEEIGLTYMATPVHHHLIYENSYKSKEPIIIRRDKRAFVLYANKAYIKTVQACVHSINMFSTTPVIVYLINCDDKIAGARTINWECDVPDISKQNSYIDRKDPITYRMLAERPMIVKNALLNYADEVCYVDADSVATPYLNSIFKYHPENIACPFFVEGVYDYLHVDGHGGADTREDMSTTLEAPACDLFNINQYVRQRYRQTGYFIATLSCINFLDEWYQMCLHPTILADNAYYAPYNEETIANILLWKYNFLDGLPYIYCNASLDKLPGIINNQYPWDQQIEPWFKLPDNEEQLFFIHGEKEEIKMNQMADLLKRTIYKKRHFYKMKILFLAPHLSTGGMPAFLLKRIEALLDTNVEIFVVEWANVSPDFVVQRNQIKKLVKNFYTLGEDKRKLLDIIRDNDIDIIHIDEMAEHLGDVPYDLLCDLYSNDRTWRIIETCHNVVFKPDVEKKFHPDAYAFCTPYHLDVFKNTSSHKEVIQFPIENNIPSLTEKLMAGEKLGFERGRKHVLNVGLWTKGKNQGEGLEIARKYPHMHFHFVGNRAGNFKDYWEPLMKDIPSNVTIWDERVDVDLFYKAADIFMFNSTFECSPLALREAISYAFPIIARDLPEYGNMFTPYIQPIDTDLNTIEVNYDVPTDNTTEDFGKAHLALYSEVIGLEVVPTEVAPNKVSITQHFVNNPFLEITGESTAKYLVKLFDEQGVCRYEHTTTVNHWIKLDRTYFTKWNAKVWEDGILIYDKTLDFKDQKVFIVFDSKALGDTFAWIPYCLEFQEKHNCKVSVSTFHNRLFQGVYPEMEFIEPGQTVHNLMGMYHIGSHDDHNPNKEPENTVVVPLQKVACNILGLEYTEIRPRVQFSPGKRLYKNKYVTIATNSTAGCKFWQKEDWQKTIDYLVEQGYEVVNVSKEINEFNHCTQILNDSIANTMSVIHYSEFFIGLSSGLSWLAWGMEKEVIMISNFTNKEYEFSCHRPVDTKVCHGCFNNPNFKFDKGDWSWCPVHKGTLRQWECQKAITAEMIIEEIQTLI